MATRTVTRTDLVRQETLQFIRAQSLVLTLTEARPGTRMYVFFGDEDVTHLCAPQGEQPGSPIVTSATGGAVVEFQIPAKKFNTGAHAIVLSEAQDRNLLEIKGNTYGSARATFNANGRLDVMQTTTTTTVQVERSAGVNRDPLAQSFFTYGVDGGILLSSLDLFFFAKDDSVPIRVEIRPLVNGFPAPLEANERNMISTMESQFVLTSSDASVPTRFEFSPPIYLKQDGEFCFVIIANSQQYQVFTSRMGEKSIEDKSSIYEQPYLGHLFKSENNVTWTAERLEDIKFTMRHAKFDTASVGTVRYAVDAPYLGASGTQFETVAGSTRVRYTHTQDHGLIPGSLFDVIAAEGLKFNGLTSSALNSTFTVLDVPDPKTVVFAVDGVANTTGPIARASSVTHCEVLHGGMGYSSGDSVVFSGGLGNSDGVDATGTLIVNNGIVTGIKLISKGSGYIAEPSVVISSTTGSGAFAVATLLPGFSVLTNKPFEGFVTNFASSVLDGTALKMNLYTTSGGYAGSWSNFYTPDGVTSISPSYMYSNIMRNLVVASRKNEEAFMAGTESVILEMEFSTKNANVSPVLDTTAPMTFSAMHRRVSAQTDEAVNSENSSGSVEQLIISNEGSEYTLPPTVQIDAPDLEDGVQATATAELIAGAVGALTLTEGGSGYTRTPLVRIVPGPADNTGFGATAQAKCSAFNSERLAYGGSARARYVTNQVRLQLISTGVRIFSTIASQAGASVDWYIRTSLAVSGADHNALEWTRIPCNTERNKSAFAGDFKEYEFRLDDMPEYDVYDLKCVMTAADPTRAPVVKSYRVIALA